jgi:chromosome segregation protein
MFLKKVELSGFKSFAHKTTLEFLPACAFQASAGKPAGSFISGENSNAKRKCGITAIVGPNGSGKSNVADAIRWAMGEQSMKNLRGKKSEDIIFAGSGKKARLGSAWATLYFDNADKRIPLEFSEVTITRKFFRSGESEYLINNSKTRLIDVIDLLAKAGIGRESYCVINQGMSDSVLSATPIERRTILEDAAGVKQYQIKKERSIKKLESTKDNLERVGDLIKEIEPHLKMLKRQADKAQKGKGVADNLKEKQVKLFSYLWHNFQSERDNFEKAKNDLGIKMMNIQRETDRINDEISRESKEVQDFSQKNHWEKKREELFREINNLEKELIIAEGRAEIEKEKLSQNQIIESIPVDLAYVQEKLARIREKQKELIERIEKIENLEELQDVKELAMAIQRALRNLLDEAGKGKIEVEKDSSAEIAKKEKIKTLLDKAITIKEKIAVLRTDLEKAEKKIEEEMKAEREMRERFFDLERKMRAKQDELNSLKDSFNEAKIKLARVEVREEDLVNEIRNELKTDAAELKYNNEPCDTETLGKEINRLKVQLEQIGGIDPLIVEEYDETKKRFEFLSGESKDLEKAILSLKEVIKEMDQKINKVFNSAFQEINKEFAKYFRIIFGGGNAHLLKSKTQNTKRKTQVDEEDLSFEAPQNGSDEVIVSKEVEIEDEAGVDIFACPPGKKINNLSMLSGGERSLTSLALLFAIISHNPPPFAILDEVEAALDEANSRRFGRIIQELSGNTQFIIITHNRETMRQASLLYGVTMGEDGISKLLSVRLDQVENNGKIKS